jgi:hypothetical protein
LQRRADYAFFMAPDFRDPYVKILIDFEEVHITDCRYKSDPKAAKEKIEILVTQRLQAQAKLKTDHDQNRVELAIERLEREIDELVYQLYGLTEEEVAIVEGKTS